MEFSEMIQYSELLNDIFKNFFKKTENWQTLLLGNSVVLKEALVACGNTFDIIILKAFQIIYLKVIQTVLNSKRYISKFCKYVNSRLFKQKY